MNYTNEQIASHLDLAVLKPTATADDIKCVCSLANKHKIKSVCAPPIYVQWAASHFHNVSCVIGFPFGNSLPDTKYHESISAVRDGAKELDVVINYGRFLDGDSTTVITELALIVSAAHQAGVLVKAILETCFYTIPQLIEVCKLCVDLNVDFVKTSTGFGQKGVDPLLTKIMLDTVKDTGVQVKASGGIKTYTDACTYLDMGCTRLGAGSYPFQ